MKIKLASILQSANLTISDGRIFCLQNIEMLSDEIPGAKSFCCRPSLNNPFLKRDEAKYKERGTISVTFQARTSEPFLLF